MHNLKMTFLGIEKTQTKEGKQFMYIHLISGYDACKFFLSEENKAILDKKQPKQFSELECGFELSPVTYQNNGFMTTCYALKLKTIL